MLAVQKLAYLTPVWQHKRVTSVIISCCPVSLNQQLKAQKFQIFEKILCNHCHCEINIASITITFNVL